MSIPVLRHTAETRFARIAPAGFRILAALDHAAHVIGHDLTITAGTNDHRTGRHPLGEAFDVRTKDLTTAQIARALQVLTAFLGPRFTVLYEVPELPSASALMSLATVNPHASAPHFHLQPLKGSTYPPPDEGVPV